MTAGLWTRCRLASRTVTHVPSVPDECPGDVEPLLRQQVVEVVAGHAAREVLGVAAANLVGVPVAEGLELAVDFSLAPAFADDPFQFLLARGPDGHPCAVVE